MVAHVKTSAFIGLEAQSVDVQVLITGGLPKFDIVGLPDKAVAETVRNIENLGKELFNSFVSDRLEKCNVPLSAPIKLNKLSMRIISFDSYSYVCVCIRDGECM